METIGTNGQRWYALLYLKGTGDAMGEFVLDSMMEYILRPLNFRNNLNTLEFPLTHFFVFLFFYTFLYHLEHLFFSKKNSFCIVK